MEVTDTPVKLGTDGLITNLGPDVLYVGDNDVDAENGYPIAVDASVSVTTSQQLYGVSEGTSEVVRLPGGTGVFPKGLEIDSGVFGQAQEINPQTGTSYTLDSSDAGKLVTLSNAAAITLTVPQDSDESIAIGTYIDLYQLGAGQVTVVAGSGATLRVSGLTAKLRAQYSRATVQKVSANTWSLGGDLASS
jgi:hypothetical protein